MHDNYDYDGVLVQLWTLSLFKIEKKKLNNYMNTKKNLKKTEQQTTEKKLVVVRASIVNEWMKKWM